MNVIEWDADCVDDNGGIPEPGDKIDYMGDDFLVVKVLIINKSKVAMKVSPFYTKYHDDPMDYSNDWEEIDEKYMPKKETDFLDSGLTP